MTALDLLRESGAIVAELDAPDGIDADELDARLSAWLDGVTDKLGAYHAVIQRLGSEDAILDTLAARIAARRAYLARQKQHIQHRAESLLMAREELGEEPRVKRIEFSAWLQASESVRVEVTAEQLPAGYQRVRVEPDLTAIKAALKAGREVGGCRIETRRSIRWRTATTARTSDGDGDPTP